MHTCCLGLVVDVERVGRLLHAAIRQAEQVEMARSFAVVGPRFASRRVHNSQHRWPCDAVRAARTLMTGLCAATVARYVDVLALQRARRRRIVRREQEAQIHHTNRLTM